MLPILTKSNEFEGSVVVIAQSKKTYYPHTKGVFSEIVRVFVAPSSGIYTVSSLQEWMMSLIGEIKPLKTHNFREGRKCIYLGKLVFEEEFASCIGSRKILKRKISISFYPDESIAHLSVRRGKKNTYYMISRRFFEERSLFTYSA